MYSTLFADEHNESSSQDLFSLQNPYMLRARITPDRTALALKGSMVAYQGAIDFTHQGSRTVGQMFRKLVSSDDIPLMRVSGEGEVFFALSQSLLHLLHLEGDAVTINGRSLIAFDDALDYDLTQVHGASVLTGGMWNTTLAGHGTAVIASHGTPVVLDCSAQPTFVDMHAAVAWSANLAPDIVSSVRLEAFLGLGSGEAFQYAFHGPGWVIVQPGEALL